VNKNRFITDSHNRCTHLEADNIQHVLNTLILSETEKELSKAAEDTLNKNKATFFALYNSFFTVVKKDLTVINCFINKNSNTDIRSYLPKVSMALREDLFGTNAVALAGIKQNVAYVVREEHYRKQSRNLTCVASPVWVENEIIGFIGFSTVNRYDVNSLRAFIESLSHNISGEIYKCRLKKRLNECLIKYGIDINSKRTVPYLSQKEKMIIEHVIRSYSYDTIAGEVGISEATVRTYLKRVFDKFGTKNRVDTALFMLYREIVEAAEL